MFPLRFSRLLLQIKSETEIFFIFVSKKKKNVVTLAEVRRFVYVRFLSSTDHISNFVFHSNIHALKQLGKNAYIRT